MIILDANVLLYAYHAGSQHHEVSRRWVESRFSGSEQIGLPWITLQAFLRISTHAKIFEKPFSIEEASSHVGTWLDLPNIIVVEPGEQYWVILQKLLVNSQVKGPLVTDAALATLAIEHGASLATTDRDFSRFEGLQVVNPLLDAVV